MNQLLDKLLRYLRAQVALSHTPKTASEILDVGYGPKPWFLYSNDDFSKRFNITAIDNVQYEFDKNLPFKFVVADAEGTLPFADNNFDVVTSLAVLEHLAKPEENLKEIYRVLRPGGTFIITTPSPASKRLLEFLAFKLKVIDGSSIADHKTYFDKTRLKTILAEAGFRVDKLKSFELGFNIFAKATK